MADQELHPAEWLANWHEATHNLGRGKDAEVVAHLRRIPALEAANAAFSARQKWWNNKMVELEAERDKAQKALALVQQHHATAWNRGHAAGLRAASDTVRQATDAVKADAWGNSKLTEALMAAEAERDQLHAEVMEQARLLGMSGERELALRAEIDRLRKDADRLDWLADPENTIGNVDLPRECVEQNLHSLRDAIDAARTLK